MKIFKNYFIKQLLISLSERVLIEGGEINSEFERESMGKNKFQKPFYQNNVCKKEAPKTESKIQNYKKVHNNNIMTNYSKDKTTLVNKIAVNDDQLMESLKHNIKVMAQYIADDFNRMFSGLYPKFKERYTLVENIPAWYDRHQSLLIESNPQLFQAKYWNDVKHEIQASRTRKYGNHVFDVPNYDEIYNIFKSEDLSPFANKNCIFVKFDGASVFYIVVKQQGVYKALKDRTKCVDVGSFEKFRGLYFRVLHLLETNSMSCLADSIKLFLEEGLIPDGLQASVRSKYVELCNMYAKLSKYVKKKDDNELYFDVDGFYKDIISNKFKESLFGISFDYSEMKNSISEGSFQLLDYENFKQNLLECDYFRANISPYSEKQLTDINMGHWELFEPLDIKKGNIIDLNNKECFVARPPHLDIVKNGVCGIDFGTKSTVVACFKNEARLLRVGEGDFTKAPELEDYENPTVIELRDLFGFSKNYLDRVGRPFTQWEQLTVSHQAATAIFNCDEASNYSVFSELKQWTIDKKRRLKLCDRKGITLEVKPYCELKETDFDPIEVYAYYLGLYINNMNNGIYLHYVLSFPVNYELDVRNRLLKSFEKGIKKSLPPAILNDKDVMTNFKIYAGASEPAAYAISALEKLGLQPQNIGEKICYGVFDFGGGTTDFDFGIQEIPRDLRSKYTITQFGNGGDVHLGGENILLLMAYEVYKDNLNVMRKNQIPFVLPPKGELFSGAETLIFNRGEGSQHAYLNSRRLAEQLRPIWERHQGYQETFNNESYSIQMFTNKGTMVEVQLKINIKKLEDCIETQIDNGIQNFFVAFRKAFSNRDISLPIHIFLAGNSSKSPVVSQLFKQYIEIEKKDIEKALLQKNGKVKSTDKCFVLHLPLGVNERDNKSQISKVNSKFNRNNNSSSNKVDEKSVLNLDKIHTGKTGVVFGLLRSRKGAKDVKIFNMNNDQNNEVNFRYLLGRSNHKDFFHTVIGTGVPYGKWELFTWADEEDFELYFTSELKALEGAMHVSKANRLFCSIDTKEVSEDSNIFIRKVAPDKIQYAVGTIEDFVDFNEKKFKNKIYTQVLEEK